MAQVKKLLELFDFSANHNLHMKEKVAACKTHEQFVQVMKENGWYLTPDLTKFIEANFKELVKQSTGQTQTEE